MLGSVIARAQSSAEYAPVTDAMLQNPEPADWLNWRRTLDGWGYSPLDDITTDNVHRLQLVWASQLGEGVSQATPLVHEGVMFVPNTGNGAVAFDATTGDQIWSYAHTLDQRLERPSDRPPRGSRSIALYERNVYLGTTDAHIVALDAATGEVAWDHTVADATLGYRYSSGPIVANGKNRGRHDRLSELQERRLFHLRAQRRDRRGGVADVDHRRAWRSGRRYLGRPLADVPCRRRFVDSGSFDPGTNLTYHSTSQAKPWARVSRKTDGDALYTNSVLAIDSDTGELAWYYQFTPGETHDLDDVFESVLIDHNGRRSLFKMGKLGILWELDRTTGSYVAGYDLGYQDVLDLDPRTGRVTYRPEMIPRADEEITFCPNLLGVKNWPASAYHPGTERLYIPIHPSCVTGVFTELDQVVGNNYYADRGFLQRESTLHPDSPDHGGYLIAMDIASGDVVWRHAMATRPRLGALTTAGGIVVSADTDRNLYFLDVTEGEVLFSVRLPASAQGHPVTYAVDGRQFIAVPVGGNRSNAVYAFALPEESD